MAIYEHITTFAGLPVVEFDPHTAPPADPGAVAWRVSTDYDGGRDLFELRMSEFAGTDWASRVTALVIGEWGESYENDLQSAELTAERFPALRALFLGEMVMEENEISWINQADLGPLLTALPELTVLRVRGSEGLEWPAGHYPNLRELAFESGGLPAHVVRAVGESDLPAMNHLELWLGTDNYGGDATVEDLAPILAGSRLPALRYLGLRDAEIADAVAAAVAGAPVVAQLEVLDLSLGMLSDVGASALLAGQPLTHLRRLDLHHHFLTETMMKRLTDDLGAAGVEVDLSEAEGGDSDDRYIAVSE